MLGVQPKTWRTQMILNPNSQAKCQLAILRMKGIKSNKMETKLEENYSHLKFFVITLINPKSQNQKCPPSSLV